jgi:transketolase
MLEFGGRGHLASAFSILEIVRILYDRVLKHDPKNSLWEDRDRFVLSKGHGCMALYSILSEHGYFSKEELKTFCKIDSRLGGHPEKGVLPGIEVSTGSLGHGLAFGIGLAVAAGLKNKSWRTFVLLGDGELNEGSIWESLMHAYKHNLSNLTIIIDFNRMQASGESENILSLKPLGKKFKSFGFEVFEIDGHNLSDLYDSFILSDYKSTKPKVIIANTVKGKGVHSVEVSPEWHHKTRITLEEIHKLRLELTKI